MRTQSLINNLDKILAFLGIFFSIPLIVYLSLATKRLLYINLVHIIAVILTLFSCLIWLLIREKASLKELKFHHNRSFYLTLNILFLYFLICSILSIYFRPEPYVRSLEYFIFTSVMVGIVSLEILFVPSKKKCLSLTLLQIISIGLSLRFSQMLIFPNVVGTDPWWHQMFTLKTLSLGHLPEGYPYSNLPLFHLEISSTSLITGLNYKLSTMFSISFLQVVLDVLFIFLLGKFLFNEKVGMLSGLLLVIANQHINKGFEIIPNTFGITMVIIIIYLLFKLKNEKFLISTFLAIFFMMSLILTNTLAVMGMAIVLFVGWIAFEIYRRVYLKSAKIPVSLTIVILFSVGMFALWTYASGYITVLAHIIKRGFSIDTHLTGYTSEVPILERLFNNLGMSLFFVLSFIGCFYMISRKYGNPHTFAMAIIGVFILALAFFPYISGRTIVESRWWYLTQILLSLPLAVAFFLIYNSIKNRYVKHILLVCLTVLLSFLMILSPTANIDNHIFSPNSGQRLAFTESEIAGAAFFTQNSNEKISSDFIYAACPSSSVFGNYYNVSYDQILPLDKSLRSRNFEHDDSIKIIRNEIVDRPLRSADGLYRLHYDPNIVLSSSGFNRIYDSGVVTAYL